MTADEVTRFRISTSAFEKTGGIDAFWETFGRTILQVELDPLQDIPLDIDMTVRALPGFGIASGSLSPIRNHHPSSLIDGDDVVLVVMQKGAREFQQAGREGILHEGQAVLTTNGEVGTSSGPLWSRVINFRLSREILVNQVANLDDALARPIPKNNGALRLMLRYVDVLNDQQALATPDLRRAVVAHMHYLAALVLRRDDDPARLMQAKSVRAARLHAIKADILRNIERHDLSLNGVAQRQQLSRSYVGQLLAAEATTFTAFVLTQRLARAHSKLSGQRFADRPVSAIAYESGFGDLSYFNRTFRRIYGATPSDVRARALSELGHERR